MPHRFTNELIHETSPYLLQHAHNPVQWYPWGEKALAMAKERDNPILVSIGYAACHWCHVMERESFEDEEVAAYMNEHFINIKIDREERPDLDHIYMDAVQAIAGNGGWPLNVFLTTEAKPFYGGTYFPPAKAFNRPSWKEILFFINNTWEKRRDEIEQQAETLLEHIRSSTRFISSNTLTNELSQQNNFTEEQCKLITNNLLKSADTLHGGFGNAPKFPQTFIIQCLLHSGSYFSDNRAFNHAILSLRKMLQGGIYDQLAGGMARYSTDDEWLAPHFEKMLYDNALLVSVLCDAFQLTGDIFYKESIEKTLLFLLNEMEHQQGGFYAAIDADSEGIEGKFYVWEKEETDSILEADSEIFCEYYGITEMGNWEHKNILHVSKDLTRFAQEKAIDPAKLESIIGISKSKLLRQRNKRIRPATDDKILLSWNALLLTAFCKASAALGEKKYLNKAIELFSFLQEKFSDGNDIVYHSYKNGKAKHPACLDDYAYLLQSCIFLQQSVNGQAYLLEGKKIMEYVLDNFYDEQSGFFYFTHKEQTDVVARKIEIYDGAIPSGNSIMAENLFYMSVIFDKHEWWLIANRMLNALSEIIFKHPSSFGVWACLIMKQVAGTEEIIITGKNGNELIEAVQKLYLPGKVLHSSDKEVDSPLLKNKIYGEQPRIYLCKNYSCSPPIPDIIEFYKQLKMRVK